jgi:DNA-binding PadR family transcriptional regulator
MRMIDERTDGAWRPGPGTIYPLMKGLVHDRLAKVVSGKEGGGTKAYLVTPKGHQLLEEMQESLASMGRRERVLGRLFFDLLPAGVFIPVMINRYKEGVELFRQKISEIPQPERDGYLKDIKLFLESQLAWISERLEKEKVIPRSRPKVER